MTRIPASLAGALVALALMGPAGAAAAAPSGADSIRIDELERKVDVLTQEIESLRLGAVAETTSYTSRLGLAPAASKVYEKQGVSIGGYGEFLLAKPGRTREDGTRSELPPTADFLRAVFYVGYKFSDELLLNTEIEIEHAGIFDHAEVQTEPLTGAGEAGLTGEVTLEFAYLEWARHRAFGVRAGKLLVPIGLTNEIHEPPTFPTVRRPDVEGFIIPTTWAGRGAGFAGELPSGVSYRAYVVEGLDARGFRAESGIREGRQERGQALLTHPAFAGRVDWSGWPGLLVGVSGFTGDAWQGPEPLGRHISSRVTLLDAHGRLEWRGLRSRALYAKGHIEQNERLSDALGLIGSARIGEFFSGGFLEAAYDVLSLARGGSGLALLPYARFERYDTQDGLAAPAAEDPALHHTVTTVGLEFKPHPNVAVKADRQWIENDAKTGIDQWNLAIGYLF